MSIEEYSEYAWSWIIVYMLAACIDKLLLSDSENWWWLSAIMAFAWVIGKFSGRGIREACGNSDTKIANNIYYIFLGTILSFFLFGVLANIINWEWNALICSCTYALSHAIYSSKTLEL